MLPPQGRQVLHAAAVHWPWQRLQRTYERQDTEGTEQAHRYGAAHGEQDATAGGRSGARGCTLHHSRSLQSDPGRRALQHVLQTTPYQNWAD